MNEAVSSPLVEALRRTNRGEGDRHEMAGALAGHESLYIIVPPADLSRWMGDLDNALKEKGYGKLKTSDAEKPRYVGLTTEEGAFVPRAFSDDTLAHEYAVLCGLIDPGEAMAFMTRSPVNMLYECMVENYAGLILDDGTEHKVNLDRNSIARLYALLTLEEFALLPVLHIVMKDGQPLLQREQDESQKLEAFAYDSKQAAHLGVQQQMALSNANGVSAQESPTRALIERLLRTGVTSLFVNPTFPNERWYEREDLARIVQLLGGDPAAAVTARIADAPQPGTASEPDLDPQLGTGNMAGQGSAAAKMTPLQWANRYPTYPVWPPPGRSDVESQAFFKSIEEKAAKLREEESPAIWEYVDSIAFALDLYVPVHKPRVDGLIWPQFFNHFQDDEKTLTSTYSAASVAQEKFFPGQPIEPDRLLHLAGIEALRWAWGAPATIDDLAIDVYGDSPSWVTVPNFWALSAIYPHFVDVPDLEYVANVGLAKIGSLPGARGLKPEVVRALVQGWKSLSSIGATNGASPPTVEYSGRSYIPVFSDPDQYFAFVSANPEFTGKPEPTGVQAPFERWLHAARGCDGVILDPAGLWPLTLDHTDLLYLDQWMRQSDRQPTAYEIALQVGELLEGGAISPKIAGRILADWPRYYVGIQRHPDGGASIMTLPDVDCCPIFTSQEIARTYINVYRNLGLMTEGMKPVPILHKWTYSVFVEAKNNFTEGACVDPVPLAGGGVRVAGEMLEAALERIDEKLKPRVPGFVEGV